METSGKTFFCQWEAIRRGNMVTKYSPKKLNDSQISLSHIITLCITVNNEQAGQNRKHRFDFLQFQSI